jgi:hypothetical protein
VTAPPATVTAIPAAATALPKLIPAADLIGAAAVNGGEMRLVSLASPRDPEAKSLEWSGVSNGNQLTLKVAWQGAASVVLYASVLRSPGAGSLRVLVNGRELGAPLELAFSRETTSKLALGQVELQPGENTVTFVAMPSQEGAQMRVSLLSLSIEK